jgi:cell wall-associated NlpC family hydrolase
MAALFSPLLVVAGGLAPATASSAQAASMSRVQARGLQVVQIAASKRGTPYVYGATGPRAFDCSGFTRWVYARVGLHLPRTAAMQYRAAHRIGPGARRPGDLVFFHGRGGVYHVGIYAGGGGIWHAPHTGARVRWERIWTHAVSYGRVG